MYGLFLCGRYLRKRRMAFFGVAAVGLCVGLLIVITSLFNGFLGEFHRYWQRKFGQVELVPMRELADWQGLTAALEATEAVGQATAENYAGALLYLGRGDVRGVMMMGLEEGALREEQMLREGLLLGEGQTEELRLTGAMRERAGAWAREKLGAGASEADLPTPMVAGIGILGRPNELTDEYDREAIAGRIAGQDRPMFLITGRQGGSRDGEGREAVTRKTLACWVVDAVQTGDYGADTTCVYVPFETVREVIGSVGPDGRRRCAGRVRIHGAAGASDAAVAEAARQGWRAYAAEQGWPAGAEQEVGIHVSEQSPQLQLITREIRKQLAIMQLIMGLICGVVALLIFVILLMVVTQKKRDIGILRALGARRRGVAGTFVSYGGSIGAAGSALGLGLGVWATQHINTIEGVLTKVLGFKIWKSGSYIFSEIPKEVDWGSVWWILMVGVLTAMVGAAVPAVRASRMAPVEALRCE